MKRKKNTAKIVLFVLFFLGLLLCGLVLSIAFWPPTLHVDSDPATAAIYLNCFKKKTGAPAHILIKFFLGSHKVVVSENGYVPHTQEVSFSLFRRNAYIDAKLEPETFTTGDSNITVGWVDGSRYPTVKAMVKVKDRDGQLINRLNKDAVSLVESREELCIAANPSFNISGVSKVDIVFFIDVTGSMSSSLSIVKQNIKAFCDHLLAQNLNFRLAGYSFEDIVPYKDIYPFTPEFTDNAGAMKMVTDFKSWLATLKAEKGGDGPENCLDSIIDAGNNGLNFREDATKVGVLITDTMAHVKGDGGDSPTTATFRIARAKLRSMGIKLYYASPVPEYEIQLGGQSLGWPFSAFLLTQKFSEELIGWHVISFKDRIPYEKTRARRCTLRIAIRDKESGKPQDYVKDFVFYPLLAQ